MNIHINTNNPDGKLIDEAAALLQKGEMIIYPTDTIYGIGADIENETAVERIFKLKNREKNKPVICLSHSIQCIERYVKEINDTGRSLIEKFWPGPLTLIFFARENVIDLITGRTGKIGFRIPDNKFCLDLLKKLGRPITSSSANISGETPAKSVDDLNAGFRNKVSMVIDAGDLISYPSTVIDATGDSPVLIREGSISKNELEELISFNPG